jgi:uncharacterized protein (TIGR03435 family)
MSEFRIKTLLTRYLSRYGEPPHDQATGATNRVWQELQPQMVRTRLSVPVATSRRTPTRWAFAAAAALVMAVGAAMLWRPADDALYRVVEGDVYQAGTIRSNGGGGAVLALRDGSRVEMRERSELSLERTTDGIRIRLSRGGIIVNAAEQRRGHLYVQTKDMTVSVVGTVFLVNAGDDGSRVAVIEGEVRVRQGTTEKRLLPGEQVATTPAMASPPIAEGIAWSRDAGALVGLLQHATVEAPAPERQNPETPRDVIQPAASPKWEVVSVRRCENTDGGSRQGGGGGGGGVVGPRDQFDPERMVLACRSIAGLIASAYVEYANGRRNSLANSISNWVNKFEGLPRWRSESWTIEAKAEKTVDSGVMRGPMLQAILEDRFKLKIRQEDREIPLLALTVVKGGPKLKPHEEGSCIPGVPNLSTERAKFPAGTVFCRRQLIDPKGPKPTSGLVETVLDGATIEELIGATMMGTIAGTGKPIIDKTGIAGKFDFKIEHALPPANIRIQAQQTGRPESDFPASPTIREAIENQLGLTLVETKGPWPHFVIEHVERPSPN